MRNKGYAQVPLGVVTSKPGQLGCQSTEKAALWRESVEQGKVFLQAAPFDLLQSV